MSIGAQVRYVFVFVTSLWLASLVSSRLILFRKEFAVASKHYDDDMFTLHTVCSNNDIRANMGRNGEICDRASIATRVPPWQTALHEVVTNTYLCGTTECTQIIGEATSTLSSLIFSVVCMCISPWLFVYMFNHLFKKVDLRAAKRRVREQHHDLLPLIAGQNDEGAGAYVRERRREV